MFKLFSTILLLTSTIVLNGQINYKGYIGKYPVELVADVVFKEATAIYAYQKFDDPIVANGIRHKDTLILFEKNEFGDTSATLTFLKFDEKNQSISGTWKNLKTKKELPIKLDKEFELVDGDNVEWPDREIIQQVSYNNYYFKLVISKTKDSYYPRVTGVKILQKKTDSLIQFIKTDCQLFGLDNIEVDDYNFDGIKDFSVFEQSYAGSNTSRVYFLYDRITKEFFDSKFEGVSLEFNQKTKRIIEHNECCAGTIHTTATYKLVNNKMVLIEQHCFVWNEKKQDLVERPMKDCQ
ncbi:MAG: hypothetical protein JST75_18600 [Bacteroidetes bacterium]|nr:hypothetical protein [Bacteroidota bacterium]